MLRILLIVLFYTMFTGCSNHVEHVKIEPLKPLPIWVTSTQKDTPSLLFGVGSGDSYEGSVTSALNAAISKLNVSVSSSFSSKSESEKFSETEFIRASMQSINKMTVQNTKINNFKVNNTTQRGGKFYSLIEIDKIKFKKSLKLSISKDLREILKSYNLLKKNPFRLRSNKKRLYFQLSKIKYNNSLLTSLNGMENKSFSASINKLKYKIDSSNIIFKIASRKNKFSNILSETLLEHGFENGNDINVFLNYKVQKLNSLDKYKFKIVFKKGSNIVLLKIIEIKVRKGSNQISLVKQYFKDELNLLLEIQ